MTRLFVYLVGWTAIVAGISGGAYLCSLTWGHPGRLLAVLPVVLLFGFLIDWGTGKASHH